MADLTGIYSAGTVSVAAGGTTVTGVGTSFVAALVRAGDLFCKADFSAIVMVTETPTTPTSLKVEAWPAAAGALAPGSNYKIIRLSDAGRISDAMMLFASGLAANVGALAGLALAANKGIYATGAGALATFDQTAWGRAIQGLTGANGKIPVATGANTAAMRDILGTVAQSGGVPTGALMESGSNANGSYERYASGLAICQMRVVYDSAVSGTQTYTLPASMISSVGLATGGPTNNSSGDLTAWKAASPTIHLVGTSINIRSLTGGGAVNNIAVSAIAIGRWI